MPVLNDTPGRYIDADDILARWRTISITYDYNAKSNDFVLADATDNNLTIQTPKVSTPLTNIQIAVMKVDSSINSITINPGISAKINNEATLKIFTQYKAITLITNGTDWFTIAMGGLGIVSQPSAGKVRITNMYYNPATGLPEFEVET